MAGERERECDEANSNFSKVNDFLISRNLEYLSVSFLCNKIDDKVAGNVNDSKLMELGLAYGDILAYRQCFPMASSSKTLSYHERGNELKAKLKRNHSIGEKDILHRSVKVNELIKITIGLKCLEQHNYVCKRSKSGSIDCPRMDTHADLHQKARNLFKVPSFQDIYLGFFDGKKLDGDAFKSVEHLYLLYKEKKKALHLYLYYPITYGNLEFKGMLEPIQADPVPESIPVPESDYLPDLPDFPDFPMLSDKIICGICSTTYTGGSTCLHCEQDEKYERSLETDAKKLLIVL
eukprot:gene2220-2527_t